MNSPGTVPVRDPSASSQAGEVKLFLPGNVHVSSCCIVYETYEYETRCQTILVRRQDIQSDHQRVDFIVTLMENLNADYKHAGASSTCQRYIYCSGMR